ncbi:MAG TPA: glycoside hydrolase family 9 protein [Phycisphaerae bacterium]|nr:glycoside hydrolase family 9 protein [Phycisphaerales bacterium]HRX85013.1 glycoside hydrolase family 9 protein [Phycisphaerae bacterium]
MHASFTHRLFAGAAAIGIVLSLAGPAAAEDAANQATAWVRVNEIGYLPDDPKIAVLSSAEPLQGAFTVGEFTADIGADCGAWGPFAHNYRLDFTKMRKPGRYRVHFGDVASPEFPIAADAYARVPGKLLDFMRLQRCGDNPVTGKKCHQQDAIDVETGKHVDLVGGWHDAADRIKHMITTTYCVAALKLAGADAEATYGADMVRKIHPDAETVYVQVADDRDHGLPHTLWHTDQTDYGWGPGGPRPAYPALGKPQGPKYQNASTGVASLAGRAAAALALNGDVTTAKSLYALGRSKPGAAMSVPVKAPYYYGEDSWHDDMEWAATELYVATHDRDYLAAAMDEARQAGASDWMGRDAHGHYQCFPYVNLAHWRLYPFVDEAAQRELAGFYRTGLERVRQRAEQNPYRLGTPLVWCSTNDVIAFATQAVLYEQMTGDRTFRPLAAEARDWIFGRNPWGVSFVIGVPANGVASRHPHHLMHLLDKVLPVGGLVDGPVTRKINAGLKFAPFGDDAFARFQSDVAVYHDDFEDFSTNEPIIDGTVSLLLLLHVWEHPAP